MKAFRTPALLPVLLAGCASLQTPPPPPLTVAECRSIDWQRAGLDAGESARPFEAAIRREVDCADLGVGRDVSLFRAGYERGLDTYCTPEILFRASLRGGVRPEICGDPWLLELASIGADHRRATAELNSAESRVRSLRAEVRKRRDRIAKHSARIEGFETRLAAFTEGAPPAGEAHPEAEIRHAAVKYADKLSAQRAKLERARRALPRARRDLRIARDMHADSAARVEGVAYGLSGP